MSIPNDRRTRKRLVTRQSISDAATRLFMERGFDNVTVEEIAEAADVGRKTVFNHFARKEDMFFDLDDQARNDMRAALLVRGGQTGLVETLRLFAHAAVTEQRPYIHFFEGVEEFVKTAMASEALKARARSIRDELTAAVAEALSSAAGSTDIDSNASLAASLVVSTWSVAYLEAHRIFREQRDAEKAKSMFLAIVDRGSLGLNAAMEGTPYA